MDHHAQSGTEHAEQRLAEARELLRQSQAEAERLRHQLQSAQRHAAGLSERRRAAEAQTQTAARNNRRMVELLEATRAEITTLKENLDAVTHPPFTFATLEAVHAPREPEEGVETGAVVRGGADVVQNGRRLRVTVSPLLDAGRLTPGAQVLLDESSSIVGVAPGTGSGQLLRVKEALPDGGLVLAGTADEERVVRRAPALEGVDLLRELADVFLLLPFERAPEPRDDFFAAVFRGRAGEDARVAMSLTLSTMATTRPEVKRGVTGLVVVARDSTAL